MTTAGWIVESVMVALVGFAVGFIFHALRWPLSEDACAIEAAVWRKRALEAQSKLRKVKELSDG